MRKVLETLREKGNAQQVLDGYHGMLIENFETDAEYYRAVDTVAGQRCIQVRSVCDENVLFRLFYHIVDNDRISIKILEEINKLKLPGDVNFFPLNRLTAPNNVNYPETPVRHLNLSCSSKLDSRRMHYQCCACCATISDLTSS